MWASPSLERRKYGSVEDSIQQPGLVLGSAADRARKKRWLALIVVGGLAVVGMTLAHLGPRLPSVTIDTGASTNLAGVGKVDTPPGSPTVRADVRAGDPFVSMELSPLAFTAVNFYHLRDGKPGQDYPWLKDVKLIEPYRETTLNVTTAREGFEYRWEIRAVAAGEDGAPGNVSTATGAECSVILTQLEENIVSLEEISPDGRVTRRLEEAVVVKYVRREIRTLTDDEREELLDAMFELWATRVVNGDGAEMYGEDYADIYAINRLHFKAASPFECDHFHDGLGFLTSHSLMSNTFEFSLQLVNPKLTLPYWDFTIETATANGDAPVNEAQAASPLFSPEWFGTYDAVDHMVKDGRWAYTEIPKMNENNPGGISPDVYGKLRAPWNINDRAYLTRGMGEMCGADVEGFYPWPTCESHYKLTHSYTDFYSWVWYSLYDPHGPVHVWIGGVLDCEKTYRKIGELTSNDAAKNMAYYAFIHRKNLFRSGNFECEGTAGVDEDPADILSSGRCGCLGYDLTSGESYIAIYDGISDIDDMIGDFDSDTKREVVETLCSTPTNDGDHLQASSSLDPSFWPTHPTMERAWMFTVLTGQITDYTWPDTDISYTASDGTTVSESLSLYDESCAGHRGSDVFPFGLLEDDEDGFEVKTGIRGQPPTGNVLTNREVLQSLDPRSNSLNYIYDTFKWDQCDTEGFAFDDAWDATSKPSAGRRPVFAEGATRTPMYSGILNLRKELKSKKSSQS